MQPTVLALYWRIGGREPESTRRIKSGGDLEQIKFLPGHSSIQTTERYLGSEREIVWVKDSINASMIAAGIEEEPLLLSIAKSGR